jgi:hypothetical protein
VADKPSEQAVVESFTAADHPNKLASARKKKQKRNKQKLNMLDI